MILVACLWFVLLVCATLACLLEIFYEAQPSKVLYVMRAALAGAFVVVTALWAVTYWTTVM